MPNKTIYVAEDDLPLFERAQKLSGDNLSSAVVRALRRFIEIEEGRKVGLEEITLLVGKSGAYQRKRFLGVRLVRWLRSNRTSNGEGKGEGKGTTVMSVYHTARKRFALHVHVIPDWEYSWGDPDQREDPNNKGFWGSKIWSFGFEPESYSESGEHLLKVFESLEELRSHIPDELYTAVVQAMENPPLEDLDI